MTAVRFLALPTADARALQAGGPDANQRNPERKTSDGRGNPCRHCLQEIAAGEEMLVLAYRPFSHLQPYAEVGPIFLHAEPCERHQESAAPPAMFLERESFLMRGYTADERIKYGTGQVVETGQLAESCAALLKDPELAFVHLRSVSNNCYHCRVERAA